MVLGVNIHYLLRDIYLILINDMYALYKLALGFRS